MKGIRIHAYGPPERLSYEDIPDPEPGTGEVIIEVAAAGVNPADYKYRSGMFAAISPRALPFTPGMDVCGPIVALGRNVSRFKVGDRVLAMLYLMGNGGYAERVAAPAEWCAPMPPGLDPVIAATLPTPATTASEWIDVDLHVERGQRILVTGAAGAVGRIACYVARQRGAHVTAGVRAGQLSAVMYADDVLNLDTASISAPRTFDCIADGIGGQTAASLLTTLRAGGVLSTIATDPIPNPGLSGVTLRFFGNHADAVRLEAIALAVAAGELAVQAPTIMKLSDSAQAHARLEQGGAGKIVLVPERRTSSSYERDYSHV